MKTTTVLAILCWLPLAACSDWKVSEDQPAPHQGEAVHQNIAAQIANPKAPAEAGRQTLNGERAGLAVDRYTKGKTTPPEDMEGKTGGN